MRRQIAAEIFSTKFHENPSSVPRGVTNEEKGRQIAKPGYAFLKLFLHKRPKTP